MTRLAVLNTVTAILSTGGGVRERNADRLKLGDDGGPTDCWPSTGGLNAQGRGVFWRNGRAVNPDEAVTIAARLEVCSAH